MLWWPKPELHSTQELVAGSTVRMKTALAESWIQLVPQQPFLLLLLEKEKKDA